MVKWRNLPGVVHWGRHVVLPRIHGINEGLLSPSVPFSFIVLPTRLSARCHPSFRPGTASIRSCLLLPPGFLTRGRMAIVQEVVRFFFFCFHDWFRT